MLNRNVRETYDFMRKNKIKRGEASIDTKNIVSDNKGSVLVEIIIVVAIIAIIIAVISICAVNYVVSKSETSCIAKRTHIASQIAEEISGKKGNRVDIQLEHAFKNKKLGFTCARGGKITLNTQASTANNVELRCSFHDADVLNKTWSQDVMNQIINVFTTTGYDVLDSEDVLVDAESDAKKAVISLNLYDIDLQLLGARDWSYYSNPSSSDEWENYFMWTIDNIDDISMREIVPAIRYNFVSGRYAVIAAYYGYKKLDGTVTPSKTASAYRYLRKSDAYKSIIECSDINQAVAKMNELNALSQDDLRNTFR